MDFDGHHHQQPPQEVVEEEEDDQEMAMEVSPPHHDAGFGNNKLASAAAVGGDGAPAVATRKPVAIARYKECQKNHAVTIGAHALDGCGEFLAAGEEGSIEAFRCAACNCHRNFHRKEIKGGEAVQIPATAAAHHHVHPYQFPAYYMSPAPPAGYLHHHHHLAAHHQPRLLALPPAARSLSREDDDVSNPSSGGGGGGEKKKRHRTKFTQEQKEKMLEFAERVGWRIQKQDDSEVERFCLETCVKRRVLKVWMHNNKNTLGKKP